MALSYMQKLVMMCPNKCNPAISQMRALLCTEHDLFSSQAGDPRHPAAQAPKNLPEEALSGEEQVRVRRVPQAAGAAPQGAARAQVRAGGAWECVNPR